MHVNNSSFNQILINVQELRQSFKENRSSIARQEPLWKEFKTIVAGWKLHLSQLQASIIDPQQRNLAAQIRKKVEKISDELKKMTPFYLESCLEQKPQDALLHFAERFKKHEIHAMEDFEEFEKKHPEEAANVFAKLWQLKGHPGGHCNYGEVAFHNREGYSCLDSERAEALTAAVTDLQQRLLIIRDMFLCDDHPHEHASRIMTELEAAHPKIADVLYGKVWQAYGSPKTITHPDIATFDFGREAFHNQHPSPKFQFDRKRIAQAVQNLLPDLPKYLDDSQFLKEESLLRHRKRCQEVVKENLDILVRRKYVTPSGQGHSMKESNDFMVKNSRIYPHAVMVERKSPRCPSTHFELRAQSAATAAYDLSLQGKNILALNVVRQDGSTPEIDLCTSVAPAIEKGPKEGGALYSPHVTLFRLGREGDYQLLEQPAQIALATVAEGERGQWRDKIRTVLKSAYENGHDTLVLGALPVKNTAEIYLELLQKEFEGCFKKVVFALVEEDDPESFRSFARAIYRVGEAYRGDGKLFREY